ncbi:unnamed protein product [Phyllotreta striolata]|uniref:Proton-coupled folate transporter n=1 Tax=Phyllotreta striolata TaxID=444603 RepID=A0A9N9TNM9_PHYSR|nr:unnamed protein product [Phyllotreta striolata]
MNRSVVDKPSKMSDKKVLKGLDKLAYYASYVTVEPTLVLYMMAFMTTSVIEQSFYVYKSCIANHGYNETICRNLNKKQHENITKEVQVTTSNFLIWNNIAGHAVPIVLALFMGAWSDKRGRKLPLIIGLTGKLIFSLMIVVNSLNPQWPVEYIIYTATLPSALSGADVAIFASSFTYLIDVSSLEYRTMRVTVLEVAYLATMPLGVALGSYLYNYVLNKSYTYMFIINSCLMIGAILYSSLRLRWRTNLKQRPLSEAPNKLRDFFDYNHLVNTVQVMCKRRPNNRRIYLLVLVGMMSLYTFQRDEREIMYMYCQRVFHWNVEEFSKFRTVQSALQDVILLIAVPLMSRVLGLRDTVIIMFGAIMHSSARIFYATANAALLFYIGGVIASFGPVVAPVIRSLVSKIITESEKGKVFAVLAVADVAVPILSGTAYSSLYNLTRHSSLSAVYYLTMATQLGVFCLVLYIHFKTKPNEFEEVSNTNCDSTTEKTDEVNLDERSRLK